MALLTRRKDTGDTELLAARIERAEAFAEHAAAEAALRAANDPSTMGSQIDKLMAAATEFRARKRLSEADRRWQQADDLDKRRRRELVEERLRPICRREIELLDQAEQCEIEKGRIIAEASEEGVTVSQDWTFLPIVEESELCESWFRSWRKGLSPRL